MEVTERSEQNQSLTRRGFCNGLLLTGAGLMMVAGTGMSESVVGQRRGVAYPPMKIDGAGALMPGSALFFNYPRTCDPAILARTDDGSYYAYSQKCSHLGCSVKFSRAFNRLDCPCHRGSYDVKTGLVLNGPPQRGLDEIILQVRGAEVWAVGRQTQIDNPIAV
jgi:Rieske Fe-S protein